ncbi:MAG: response regulator [Lachnospiraceae bacterium]|nr:response regulator [Lachnospiraceae bacterium]
MKRAILLVIIISLTVMCFPANCAFANNPADETNYLPGYEAVRYGKESGLLSVEVNAIAQTVEGYIWIGTYSGLYRYDGRVFEKVSPDARVSSVMSIYADSRGRLWIGTNDTGVCYYVPEEGESHFLSKEDGLSADSIRALTEDPDGDIYIGTVEGLTVVKRNGEITNPEEFSALGGIRALDAAGELVVGVSNSGQLFVIRDEKLLYTSHPETHGVDFTSVAVGRDGMILAGTSASKLEKFRFSDGKMKYLRNHFSDELSYFSGIYYDDEIDGWFICAENGMALLEEEGGVLTDLTQSGFESSICGALRDYQGNIWFVSNKKGIIKFSKNPFTDVFTKAGLTSNVVNCLAGKENDIYIGKDDGLCVVDATTYEKKDYPFLSRFDGIRIRHIMRDSKGNMWLSTYGKEGLYRISPSGVVRTFNEDDGTIGGRFRYAEELSDGTMIVASNTGLSFIRDDKVVNTLGRYEGLETSQILTIVQDGDGTVYAGSDGGGVYVIKDEKIVDCIDHDDGLDSLVIMRIVPYRNGFFYVTSNALYYNDRKTVKKLTAFPYTNNYDVYITADEKAWISSSAGIYIVDADELVENREYMYTLLDGSMGFNTTLTANSWNMLKGQETMLLCCTDGIREINLNSYDYFDRSCHIAVKYILADGVEIVPEADGKYHLPATRGRIQIGPAILNYTLSNPEVRMFLEGSHDEGVSGRQNTVSELVYTNLPYGKYKLHIQIIDAMDYSVARDEVFEIVKKPRFFEHIAVRVILGLAAMGAVALIVFEVLKSTVIRRQYEQIRVAKDEAERANSAKSRFLANMSHEIRTPINTIMGMDEMILREDTEGVPREYARSVTGYANDIKRASETLLGLVNDVLDLSKIESGKMNLVEQEYDVKELLRSIVTMIRVRSNQKDLTFETRIDPELPTGLYGDMGKIKQVVLNLLTNAVKYTEKGGFVLKVEVRSKQDGNCEVYFAVEDTGIGVKEEDMAKLFSPFERLDEKRNSGIQGTGLGLDISRQFVALMGGELQCESVYGEGSTFRFTVIQKIVDETPVGEFSEKDGSRDAQGYIPQFVASKARVLVVDDNEMNLLVIKGLLKGTKVKVSTAMSGKECIAMLRSENYHVVLLDHMMPEMDGPETLQKIRAELPERNDVPIIALTANGANDGGSFYKEAGFSDYLAKPVDGEALEKTLKKYMPADILETPVASASDRDEEIPADFAWLKEVDGISPEDGIRYCGGAESFVKSIETFYDMLPDNAAEIEKAFDENDIGLYTVKVHALKSSARIIGARELSALAEMLEDAGKRSDTDLIKERTRELLDLYRSYRQRLAEFSEGSGDEIDESELEDAYGALSEFIPQMDYDSVEMVIGEITKYKLPEKDREFFEKLTVLLKKLEWDEMEKIFNEMRQ